MGYRKTERPPEDLVAFCNCVDQDKDKQLKVKGCDSPLLIVDYAAKLDFKFSLLDLREWSRELSADWFPWAEQTRQWRREFFSKG